MMFGITERSLRAAVVLLMFILLLISASNALAEQDGTFSGSWSASGKWRPLQFEEGREVFTFDLSGHVNLKNAIGKTKDYWSECIGIWDSKTGSTIRCVWRDVDSSDAAYLILKGQIVKEGVKVSGEFIGGTGRLKGLSGTLSFTWSSVHRNRTEKILSGFTKDISGVYQISKIEN